MGIEPRSPAGGRGRFAPSTTGHAHPGTLLAALLCWLDARSRGAEILLRLEDLDPQRSRPGYVDAMTRDLAWLGLDWDGITHQSGRVERHAEVLTGLAAAGRVYACDCSRAEIRRVARRAPDGSFRYPGTCRGQRIGPSEWARVHRPLRLRLEPGRIEVQEEGGLDLSGDPEALFGDPLVRRRDGSFSYHFASVVDDADAGVDRVVRGRDLAPSTTLQVGLQRILGLASPRYRHHALLLEQARGQIGGGEAGGGPADPKLSKLHGAVDLRALRRRYTAPELCGGLAALVDLVPEGTACRPAELVAEFDWARVGSRDVVVRATADGRLARVALAGSSDARSFEDAVGAGAAGTQAGGEGPVEPSKDSR